jgi:photosystem II stability/assembly factor-like uncharacterized protein
MAVCLSQNGATIHSAKFPSERLFIATADGVFVAAKTKGREWFVSGSSLKGCHIGSLVMDSESGLIFAGVHKGPVYASADFGETWQVRDHGLTQPHVFSLACVNIAGKVRLYAGTEPAHLFESDDLGQSWREIVSFRTLPSLPNWSFPAPPHLAHVKNITFAPTDPTTIYVSVEQGGLFVSKDGCNTWREFRGFYEDVHRLMIRPSDPRWFYITGGNGLYQSKDGGETWEHLTDRSMRIGYPDPLLVHPQREDLMFMAGAITAPVHWRKNGTADSRIARSRDGGKRWEILSEGFPTHIRGNVEAMVMEVWDQSFGLFAGTTDGDVFYSDDEGERWIKIIAGLPPISKHLHYNLLQQN